MSEKFFQRCINVCSGGDGDGDVTDGDNIGGGEEVFSSKNGTILEFRTLVGAGTVTVTTVGNTIEIDGAGGGGGSLQDAYEVGNTITTAVAFGDLFVDGDQKIELTSSEGSSDQTGVPGNSAISIRGIDGSGSGVEVYGALGVGPNGVGGDLILRSGPGAGTGTCGVAWLWAADGASAGSQGGATGVYSGGGNGVAAGGQADLWGGAGGAAGGDGGGTYIYGGDALGPASLGGRCLYETGVGNTSGAGGNHEFNAGDGGTSGHGGGYSFVAGDGGTGSGNTNGGGFYFEGGAGRSGGTGDAGTFTVQLANGSATSDGGYFFFEAGNGAGANPGGTFWVSTGDPYSVTDEGGSLFVEKGILRGGAFGSGLPFIIAGGDATIPALGTVTGVYIKSTNNGSSTGGYGWVTAGGTAGPLNGWNFFCGTQTATFGGQSTGGNFNATTGNGVDAGDGGSYVFLAGNGGATGDGGGGTFTAGTGGATSGPGGSWSFFAGAGTAAGGGGSITLAGGNSGTTSGDGGFVEMIAGDAGAGSGGDGGVASVEGGSGDGAGTAGVVEIGTQDNAAPIRHVNASGINYAEGRDTYDFYLTDGWSDEGEDPHSSLLILTPITLAADGQMAWLKVSAILNSSEGGSTDFTNYRYEGGFYRLGGTVVAMTPVTNFQTTAGTLGWDTAFSISISGNDVRVFASGSPGAGGDVVSIEVYVSIQAQGDNR